MRFISDYLNYVIRISCLVVLLACAAVPVAADFDYLPALHDTEYQRVDSETIGRSFHIYVMLPDNYAAEPQRQYRAIYLLDGGLQLPLLGSYHRYLRALNETEPAIVIGISYGSITFEGGNYRSTDFTAPSDERDYWGGAERFQTFLADELIPEIESTYRADPGKRVIFGQSLGGQFVLYTAQTRPGLFSGHIASNPALHRNLEFFLDQVPAESSDSRLFVGAGTRDNAVFREPLLRWIEHWTAVDRKPWQLRVEALEDHTHASAPPVAFWRGLNWLDSP